MLEKFIDKNFTEKTLALITIANSIIDEYMEQGFTLTLRQLYYQFVAKDIIPNTQRSYNSLAGAVNNGRLAGLIDWDAIEDRTRNLARLWHFKSPRDAVAQMRKQYYIDMWDNQPNRVEVWIEKEALAGVIESTCNQYDVPFFACRGYVSQSELYSAGIRARVAYEEWNQDTIIIHLGDHDPSGIDMTRDNQDRTDMFAGYGAVQVERIALNMDQVNELNPPPNPAKITDSRAGEYIKRFGRDSWELDALSPAVINKLIEVSIQNYIDPDAWDEMEERVAEERGILDEIISNLEQE